MLFFHKLSLNLKILGKTSVTFELQRKHLSNAELVCSPMSQLFLLGELICNVLNSFALEHVVFRMNQFPAPELIGLSSFCSTFQFRCCKQLALGIN